MTSSTRPATTINLDALTAALSPKQIRSIVEAQNTEQIALWTGAVAAGKTVASLIAFMIALADAPQRGLIVLIGRTLQTIERNLLELLQDETLFGPLAAHVHHTAGSSSATILGRTVHLVGANDVRAEGRIRGSTIALAYVDEATLLPETFWVMLLSRLRVPGAKLLATTNPANPAHWLRRDYILRAADVGMRHWHFTLDDNPGLQESFVARLKRQYVGLFYRRFILGQWIAAEGAIYDMWDPDLHVVDIIPPIVSWIAAGVDYGTTNPFAAQMLGLGANGVLYVVDEFRYDSRQARKQLTDAEYSQRLRQWMRQVPVPASRRPDGTWLRGVTPEYVVVDPSAASFRVQLHHDGVNNIAADNEVLDGIRVVSSLLAVGKLLVHRSCEGWISEIGGYSWDDAARLKGEDKPLKVDDHHLDAGRYAIKTTRSLWASRIHLAA